MRMEQAFYSIIVTPMIQAPVLSPELTRQSIALARALSAAARNWGLYPPEHPAVEASLTRLVEAIGKSVAGAAFTFGVTPKTLLVAGWPLPEEQSVAEAAGLLRDHDILHITFVDEPDVSTLHALLTLLLTSADELRAQGGPAKAWASTNDMSIAIEQIAYEKTLEAGGGDLRRLVAGQASLEGAGGRSEMFASRDLPPELPEWVESLQQDNVRSLSVLLITDLLRIEEKEERAGEIANDMTALVDDLLMSGDFANSALVLRELRKASGGTVAPSAARAALTATGESPALCEAATMLSDFDQATLDAFVECCEAVGPISVVALYPALRSETDTAEYARARDLVRQFGAAAVPYMTPLVNDTRWFVQRNAAAMLGATRSPDAVPALQTLLRRSDPRVLRQAVAALAEIGTLDATSALDDAGRTGDRLLKKAISETRGPA
jgi:CBS domain-containing protein